MTELPVPTREGFLILSGADIAKMTDLRRLLPLARDALRKTSDLTAIQDVRRVLDLESAGGDCLSLMYAALSDRPLFGAKVLSVFPGNFAAGLPSHRGGILLFDRVHGTPAALIDGGQTTAWRTAAASAIATDVLARKDAKVMALMGYGEQADRHVQAISAVRPIRELRVWGRSPDKARAFATRHQSAKLVTRAFADPREAVGSADIVCTVTSSREPVLFGDWLAPGTHVNAVGASVPSCRELDDACLTRADLWVDYLPMALSAAGEIVEGIRKGLLSRQDIRGEIGMVLEGRISGRTDDAQITLYRSLGVPAQDIEFANFFVAEARARGIGTTTALEAPAHA